MAEVLTGWAGLLIALMLLNMACLLWLALRPQPAVDLRPQLQPLLQSILLQLQADNQRLRSDVSQQQHQQRVGALAQQLQRLQAEVRIAAPLRLCIVQQIHCFPP